MNSANNFAQSTWIIGIADAIGIILFKRGIKRKKKYLQLNLQVQLESCNCLYTQYYKNV